ncbi:hypothetical protein EON63_15580 [archaeon]|nr:MAG: hypothetical protein EON63_15580 [archaeon]
MNLFRLAGDMAHVASILVLLLRLRVTKNANGISLKTQELYLVVFVARYLDLFTTYYSLYNSLMKILYICTTSYIIYMIRTPPLSTTYDKAHDSFLHWQFAVAPCAVIGLVTNFIQGFSIIDVSAHYITTHTNHNHTSYTLHHTHYTPFTIHHSPCRPSGPSPFTSRLSPSYPSSFCCKDIGRSRTLPLTMSSCSVCVWCTVWVTILCGMWYGVRGVCMVYGLSD